MPGFLVFLNFYDQILTEVYKLNSMQAKEPEISEELSQLSYHSHIFLLVPMNSCLQGLDFIHTTDTWKEGVEVESHCTKTMKCVDYLILALGPEPTLTTGLLPRCIYNHEQVIEFLLASIMLARASSSRNTMHVNVFILRHCKWYVLCFLIHELCVNMS